MSTQDLIVLAWTAPFIALGLGFILGGRQEAAYWADHGQNGGSVFYRGRFYRIVPEAGRVPEEHDVLDLGENH